MTAVRVKPSSEKSSTPQTAGVAVTVNSPTSVSVVHASTRKTFVYDQILDESVDQDGVWAHVRSSVPLLITGYNVSIMAYGQSGTGKSYTMGTTDAKDGIIPRASRALFEELRVYNEKHGIVPTPTAVQEEKIVNKPRTRFSTLLPKRFSSLPSTKSKKWATKAPEPSQKGNSPWVITASYIEIYNEQLRDLLADNSALNLSITEDVKGNIKVAGAQEVMVESKEELLGLLKQGALVRQTNSTAMNALSSRSHAIFTIQLTQKQVKPDTGIITTITSKLNFVDLAGSERLKNTGAQGGRAKEGISINSGLASLGKVISQLSSANTSHISYRDSKLTRLLQDSLGGRAITHLIACVTPDAQYVSETLNTLAYAQRARAIQQSPEIQQVESRDDLLNTIVHLQEKVKALQERNEHDDLQHTSHSPILNEKELNTSRSADIIALTDAANKTMESHKERADRSQEFHKAVENMIAEYEETIGSLQTALLESRAKHREAMEKLASQKAILEVTTELLEDKASELEAKTIELENKTIELSAKTGELAESQANYFELMDITESLEQQVQAAKRDMKMERALFEEQIRYTVEMSTVKNGEGEDEPPPPRTSSPINSTSPSHLSSPSTSPLLNSSGEDLPSSTTGATSLTSIPNLMKRDSMRSHEDDHNQLLILSDELKAAKTEINSLRLEHKSHSSESQYLMSRYNQARREADTLKAETEELRKKNEALENEIARVVAPI